MQAVRRQAHTVTCFLDHFQHWAAYDIRLPEGQVGGKSIALRLWTHIQVLASALRRRLLQIEGQLLAGMRLIRLPIPDTPERYR
jgi:hypothetical protein